MDDRTTDRRRFLATATALGATVLGGCSRPDGGASGDGGGQLSTTPDSGDGGTEPAPEQPAYAVETVVTGLSNPWGLSFVAGGSELLVTERPGRLRLVDVADGTAPTVSGTPDVFSAGQGGLLDVTAAPGASDPWLYLTYAASNGSGASSTHLARARLVRDEPRLDAFEVLHVAEPFVDSNAHYGSRVVIGPDDRLYVTVGDRHFKNFGPEHVAQDPTNELGTTLRLERDGSVPDDNPFVDDPGARDTIFTYGHRNPQGMAVHPETDAIWEAEHGERDGDEINVLEAGANYGWPVASFACRYGTDDRVGDSPDERPSLAAPVYYWPCGSGGFPPSGMTFYDGAAFPEFRGDLFLGTLAGRYLGRFTVDGRSVSEVQPLLGDRDWRIRAVAVAPDTGALYVAVDAADAPVVRIVPA